MKGLGSEANSTWLKTAGVLMLAEVQKHGKSPASDGRGQQLVPLTPPPHHTQGARVSFLLRKGHRHPYIFSTCIHSNTQQIHTNHPGHTCTPNFSLPTSSWGPFPREGPEDCPKQTGQAREMGRDEDRARGRVRNLGPDPRVTPLRSTHSGLVQAMWKVKVPKPKAAGPGFYPQPRHLLRRDPGPAPLWASPARESSKWS